MSEKYDSASSWLFDPKAGNALVWPLVLIFIIFIIGVFVWGFIDNNAEYDRKQEAQQALQKLQEEQTPDAQEYVKQVIEVSKIDGAKIDIETNIGRCAYNDVVGQLAKLEKNTWTTTATRQKLANAVEECKDKESNSSEPTTEPSRQITAHLVCQRYAKNYFFPYDVTFHNIAGVIYDKARGADEWVYTLEITVKSSQGGKVRYNMDCVAGHFSDDGSSAEVVMFEALPY